MFTPPRQIPSLIAVLAVAALLAVTYFVYAPGLSGNFLLDDYINLDALGRLGGIDDWRALIDFLFGSHTGTGGRPVALATFLLDGTDWPTDPRPFKVTNVLFHLLTMAGVMWLALQLASATGYDRRRQYAIALLAGAIWGLHPYLVSTVLYVVQRMAILAALFVAFGLGCYVRGRRLLAAGRARAAYVWMTLGIGLFTPLAFLSKPNGALLPALALVLDATVLRHLMVAVGERRRWRVWHGVLVYLPIATIAGYFALNWQGRVLGGYETRLFSLSERLLTESRILVDYVAHLVIPRVQTAGLYHDGFPLSTGLLSPPATLAAVLAVAGALAAGFALRRTWPIVSAGILFFLVGHILESTVVALELYFEHRNYLPSMMLAFAAAVGLVRLFDARALDHPRWVACVAAVALVASLGTFTYARAQLWGNPLQQAVTWTQENPESVRARQDLAGELLDGGQPLHAAAQISEGIRHNPESSLLRVQYLVVACTYGGFNPDRLDEAVEALGSQAFERNTLRQIDRLAQFAMNNNCGALSVDDALRVVDAALAHSGVQRRGRMIEELQYMRGHLLLADRRPAEAQDAFMTATDVAFNVEGAIQMAAVMASTGHYDQALMLLDEAEADLERGPRRIRENLRRAAVDYGAEIERLRGQIRTDAAAARSPGDA